MEELLTPKQVARAIGVSESSLKRWCDRGLIESVRTAGGHRRLPVSAVVRYLRESGNPLVAPEALGLPRASGRGERVVARGRERLRQALLEGDENTARQVVFDLYLARHPVQVLFDDVIAAAFVEIGNLWACHEAEVYQERRACEITLRLLHELHRVLPSPESTWTAIGGTLAGDPYLLPTTMAELVLRDLGWNASSLGASLPVESMIQAIADLKPRLLWLSVSYIGELARFMDQFARLRAAAAEHGTVLIIGGYALTAEVRNKLQYADYCDSMSCLHDIAVRIQAAA